MKRIFLGCGILAAVCSLTALAQQGLPERSLPPTSPPPAETRLPVPPPPAKAVTIDELLNKLDSIKAQKAALERAEKETVTLLKEKLKEQKDRLRKLGVSVEEPPPAL
jgi:hypothetical protein